MTDKQKGIFGLISAIVLLTIGVILAIISYNRKMESAFEYVKRKGAIESTTFPGSLEFAGYRFFTNMRAANLNLGDKGTYTKELIVFDNGTKILLKDIFK